MKNLIGRIWNTDTFKQSSVTFSATIITGALGALFYILAARILGPANFGLLMISVTIINLLADIGDLGSNSSIVRFFNKYIKEQPQKAFRFLKFGMEIRLTISFFVVILGFILAPFIANMLFEKRDLESILKISFLGVCSVLLYSFSTSTLQALQKFKEWSSLQIGTNFLRLITIFILGTLNVLNLSSAVTIYILFPFIGFLISFLFLPKQILKVPQAFQVSREFLDYSKWIALSNILAALSSRLDILISARLLSTTEVGFYAAASQLVVVIPQLVTALGTVIAPKMAGMGSQHDLIAYFKKTQLMVIILALLGFLSIPVVIFFIPFIYGPEYITAVPILFAILFIAMLIFLISVPIHMAIFYYFSYTKLFTYLGIINVFITGILGWILISSYGTVGAALSILIGQMINFFVSLIWFLKRIYR